MVKSVDSTDLPSGKGDKSAAKKIKQIRLPYGSIKAEPFWSGNKSVKRDNAGGRKRKHSEEMSETFGHTDITKTPTSVTSKNSINTPKSGVQTSKTSPVVLDRLRRKIRVEKARLSIQIHELRDSLDGAVAVKNFLRANQFKELIKVIEAEKEELLNSLESSDLETLKRYAAFKSSLKKIAAAGVARFQMTNEKDQ